MTRKELVKLIALKHEQTADEIDAILETLIDVVGTTLAQGQDVKITNFGKFEARLHEAGTRRNPKTGAAVHVGKRMGMGFKASNTLRKVVNADYDSEIETW